MTLKTLPSMRLAAVLHHGPYQQIGPSFQKLGEIAGPAGLFARPNAQMIGVYKDDPAVTRAEELRSAAGVSISETEAIPAGLVEERLDGGRFACFLHVGPYELLPKAFADALTALRSGGHRRREAPSLEIYLNNPAQVKPADLKTEIAIPVE